MSGPKDESITQSLAREVAGTAFNDIPESAIAAVKRLVVDHLGITYMGAALTGKGILDYARDVGGIERGPGVFGQGGEANLVIDDEVDGATG